MRRAGRVAVVVLCLLTRAGRSRAADAPGDEPTVSPGPEPEAAAPPPATPPEGPAPPPAIPPEGPAPPLAASAPKATAPSPPPDLETPSARPSADERWPLEVVRRPLTLPGGMASLAFQLAGRRPKNHVNFSATTGLPYTFNSSVSGGVSMSLGVSDRVQAAVFVPELVCYATDTPSGCDGINAHTGTGASVRFLALREGGVQIAPGAGVAVSRTSPVVLRWSAGTAFKISAADLAAVVFSPTLARNLNPAPTQTTNPWLAYLPVELEVQVAQRLEVFAVAEPWGSVGDVGRGILLEIYGGTSYTFGPLGQIALEGGTYNVLSRPAWNSNVPEWFADLVLVLWKY